MGDKLRDMSALCDMCALCDNAVLIDIDKLR